MRSPGQHGPHRKLASAGSLLLLACLLFGQFAATTHEYAALHATCPKHGELIEVDGQGGLAASFSADTRRQVSTLDDESGQTRHQHCLFVSSRGSQKNFRIVGLAASSLSTAAQWASATATDAAHPALALYLTAPKHSPPAA